MLEKPILTPTYQSIANTNTGYCVGIETQLPERQWAASTIIRQSLSGFTPLHGRKLFVHMGDLTDVKIETLLEYRDRSLKESGLNPVACISALGKGMEHTNDMLSLLKRHSIALAISDFGTISNEIRLILDSDPDYVFFDQSLVRGIAQDARRRVMLSHLISSCHTLGVEIIATGINAHEDFLVCRDMYCEMVQGDFVQLPFQNSGEARSNFPHLTKTIEIRSNRTRSIDHRWIFQQLDQLPALSVDVPLKTLFERMAQTSDSAVIPLVENDGRPLGILLEKTFKSLTYSTYGRDLISNRGWGKSLRDFVTRCPIAENATPLDQMLAIYASAEDVPGIIITNNGTYEGFLSTPSIIRALHERTLARAQDENPLTRLPGNALIGEFITDRINSEQIATLAYLDFDNFKPFNDHYGFRQGDRAILLFSQLLREIENKYGCFIGHIGGDDFFAGIANLEPAEAQSIIATLIGTFSDDAKAFYDSESRARGYITAENREGVIKRFPLLSASAVLVTLPEGEKGFTIDDISATIAHYKTKSKTDPSRIAVAPKVIQRSDSVS